MFDDEPSEPETWHEFWQGLHGTWEVIWVIIAAAIIHRILSG